MPQTIDISERRRGPAGSSRPREACTEDIESSTVTNCSPEACTSRSLRPSAGRINAVRPQTACERLSLVDTCTVSSAERSAANVTSLSGVAAAKLPPMPMKTRARPSRNARIASTTARPGSRGAVKPNSASIASRNQAGGRSQMPIVRSPWTLECPRTGQSPAPLRPMLPCSRATLTNSLIVATALRCWVMPIAQQMTVLGESMNIRAAASISSRPRPVARST